MRSGLTVSGRYSTVADSVLRFTVASSTPGRAWMARSTRATQEAQVMPPTPMVTDASRGS